MSGHSGGRGRRGGGHEEEHENHERWIVSYADFITLLFVLFVVMYAISIYDENKARAFALGVAEGFGNPRFIALNGSAEVLDGHGPAIDPIDVDTITPVGAAEPEVLRQAEVLAQGGERAEAEAELAEARAELASLEEVRDAVESALAGQGLSDRADYLITEDGLTIALLTDDVFFASASATLEPTGALVVDTLAPAIADLDYPVAAHGHANRLPLSGGSVYPSNWELSAARAASVVRRLIEVNGVEPRRLRAVGFSSTRPALPPEDPRALEHNRRVDLVVQSTASPEARQLLPNLAEADAAQEGAEAQEAVAGGPAPPTGTTLAAGSTGGAAPPPLIDLTPDITPDLGPGSPPAADPARAGGPGES